MSSLLLLASVVAVANMPAAANQARLAEERGDRAAGLQLLEDALRAAPADSDLLRRYGAMLGRAGRTDEALAVLTKAQALAPKDDDIALAIAQVRYVRGEVAVAAELAGGVAARRPGDADAQALAARSRAALIEARVPDWRVDATVSYSSFDRVRRKAWQEGSIAVSRRLPDAIIVRGRVDHARRFGLDDTYAEAGFEGRLTDDVTVSFDLGATPNADFLPEFSARAGARFAAWKGASFLVDGRLAAYSTGGVETLSPGLEQYLASGRLWLTGRLIFTWDETGRRQDGYVLRADVQATDRVRFAAGYADAPETVLNQTLTTRTAFGGIAVDVDRFTTLRVDYARDDRQRSYIRHAVSFGVSHRF